LICAKGVMGYGRRKEAAFGNIRKRLSAPATTRVLAFVPKESGPYASGGPGDVATRGASQVLSQVMGQPFVVENRPGADGIIGGEACVKSAPDGHTLCTLDSFGVSLNPVIRAKMPYDTARDLTPVVHLGFLPAGIIVNASVPANSLRELLELAKAKPGAITWGSFGLASSSNLYMEWLKNARGISFLNVPYKGASQACSSAATG